MKIDFPSFDCILVLRCLPVRIVAILLWCDKLVGHGVGDVCGRFGGKVVLVVDEAWERVSRVVLEGDHSSQSPRSNYLRI